VTGQVSRLTAGDADLGSGALFVGLGPRDKQTDALGRGRDVVEVEPEQLRPPQGAGEAYEKERPIADSHRVVATDPQQSLDFGGRERCGAAWRLAMGAGDSPQRLPDRRMARVEGLLGGTVRSRDRGHPSA